ncbi:hypothetical protein HK100_004501 [Physocladia obscura]|uniref:Macro domain-containing protein n=1 Tax=Physocladia obscura TaxID=109957 RepID=A0AAD5T6E1_9FUNG|nr:hypothetical protein HK100_004501 [Physocladia obscura]
MNNKAALDAKSSQFSHIGILGITFKVDHVLHLQRTSHTRVSDALDMSNSIPGMPDPFNINCLQEQGFMPPVHIMWILAPFDQPIEFHSTEQLDEKDKNKWKNILDVNLEKISHFQHLKELVPRIFRHGCYNTLAFGGKKMTRFSSLRDKIQIRKGDITEVYTISIVYPSRKFQHMSISLLDKAICDAISCFGEKEWEKVKNCEIGQCVITLALKSNFSYIIHLAYSDDPYDISILESCYQSCFKTAFAKNLKSIKFPRITTVDAYFEARIALEVTKTFLENHADQFEQVVFCVHSDQDLIAYNEIANDIFSVKANDEIQSSIVHEATVKPGNPIFARIGILNLDICLQIVQYIDDCRNMLQLFSLNRHWHVLGKQIWKHKCRKEGFASIPGLEEDLLSQDSVIDWQKISRRRVNDCINWIVEQVLQFENQK